MFFVCYYSTGDCGGEEEKEEVVLASPALHLQKKISTPLLVYNLHLLFFLLLFYTLICFVHFWNELLCSNNCFPEFSILCIRL